ncbi:t-snare domain-containing protein [Anaeramoeba ignava]|uniref:T-snare domain-containing protein n=1 Tax=Anaeramoeba ignava TaxID=1746090 RepID=A0A9Q0R4G2_ANAIG|nr:t-snare domain-containing protein [Anaeramoeba ignava]
MSFEDAINQKQNQRQNQYESESNFDRLYRKTLDNITNIGANLRTTKNFVSKLGKKGDTEQHREKIAKVSKRNLDLIKMTKLNIQELDRIKRPEDQLKYEKVFKDFKSIFETYQNVENESIRRQRETAPQESAPRHDIETQDNQKLLENDAEIERRRQQAFMNEEIDHHKDIIQERDEQIQEIESSIIEINEMFRDMATMVHEQGKKIETIDQNIDTTEFNTGEAVLELEKASNYQSKARKKSCYLLICIIILAIVLIVILAPVLTLVKK